MKTPISPAYEPIPPVPVANPSPNSIEPTPNPSSKRQRISKKPRHQPGTSGTLPAYSGIFFLYNFLVRDPGKRVQCDASAGTGAGSLNPGCCQRGRSGSLILGARGALEGFNPGSFSCTIFSYEIPETGVHVPRTVHRVCNPILKIPARPSCLQQPLPLQSRDWHAQPPALASRVFESLSRERPQV